MGPLQEIAIVFLACTMSAPPFLIFIFILCTKQRDYPLPISTCSDLEFNAKLSYVGSFLNIRTKKIGENSYALLTRIPDRDHTG